MASEKERLWLEEYLTCFNATEAARRAGYAWPNKQGPEKKLKFADEISERLKEKALSADEALAMLAEIATATQEDFLHIDGNYVRIDLERAKERGKLHLLKKYSGRSKVRGEEIELYDRQRAIETILKAHGVFRAESEVTVNVNVESARDEILASITQHVGQDDTAAEDSDG